MAAYRILNISFWQDPYIEELNPKEKYFYIYLMTNSKTRQCGCYEISMKLIKYETGLTQDEINSFIKKLKEGRKIDYNSKNQEFLLLNWLKHNSFKSPKVRTCIEGELATVKTDKFKDYVYQILYTETGMDSLSIDYEWSIDTGPQKKEKEKEKEEEEKKEKEKGNLEIAIDEFIKHRKQLKKPMTQKAVELFKKELNKFGSDEERIEAINTAILKGWQTVYPNNNNNNQKKWNKPLVEKQSKYSEEELEQMLLNRGTL